MENTPDAPEENDNFYDDVEAVLNDVFAKHGKILNKYVLCGEYINAEGEKNLWINRMMEMRQWDTIGLLQFCLNIELAKTTTHEFIGHGYHP